MKSIVFLLFPILLLGCATFQKPVDDSLLTEMTQQEKDSINALNSSIIVKKNEQDTSEKTLVVSDQAILVSDSRISMLNAQKDNNQKNEKLYVLSGDTVKQQETSNLTKKIDVQIAQETANQKYCVAKRNANLALFKVKEAELSVLVSQLDFEKAKIAREFQINRYGAKYDNLVDANKFNDYLNSMKDDLNKRKQEYQKALDSLKIASDLLKTADFEEQK